MSVRVLRFLIDWFLTIFAKPGGPGGWTSWPYMSITGVYIYIYRNHRNNDKKKKDNNDMIIMIILNIMMIIIITMAVLS